MPVICLDPSSIYNFVVKARSDIDPLKSDVYMSNSSSGPIAWITEWSKCREGVPLEMDRDDERINYHGFSIGLFRYREKLAAQSSDDLER